MRAAQGQLDQAAIDGCIHRPVCPALGDRSIRLKRCPAPRSSISRSSLRRSSHCWRASVVRLAYRPHQVEPGVAAPARICCRVFSQCVLSVAVSGAAVPVRCAVAQVSFEQQFCASFQSRAEIRQCVGIARSSALSNCLRVCVRVSSTRLKARSISCAAFFDQLVVEVLEQWPFADRGQCQRPDSLRRQCAVVGRQHAHEVSALGGGVRVGDIAVESSRAAKNSIPRERVNDATRSTGVLDWARLPPRLNVRSAQTHRPVRWFAPGIQRSVHTGRALRDAQWYAVQDRLLLRWNRRSATASAVSWVSAM